MPKSLFNTDAESAGLRASPSVRRELVFNLNDFDETLPGPFEWDVKRLAASIEVVARANGFSARKARKATQYRKRQTVIGLSQ